MNMVRNQTQKRMTPPGLRIKPPGIITIPQAAPRGAKSAPRAAQRRSQSGLGGHLGPTWRPRGSRRPPGGILTASRGGCWPSGAPFSKLSALVAKPSGEQAQAQDGSAGHAKRLQLLFACSADHVKLLRISIVGCCLLGF